MRTSETIKELADALAKAQGAFPAIRKGKTAKVKGTSKSGKDFEYSYAYADLSDIMDAIRKALAENGLSIIQPIGKGTNGDGLVLVTRLLHSSGQWLEEDYPVDVYERPQEQGSAITYARRYAVTALLGIAAEEDDDGQAAQGGDRRPAEPRAKKHQPGTAPEGYHDQPWDDHKSPAETPSCGHCGSINVKPDPKGPGWLICADCKRGSKVAA